MEEIFSSEAEEEGSEGTLSDDETQDLDLSQNNCSQTEISEAESIEEDESATIEPQRFR